MRADRRGTVADAHRRALGGTTPCRRSGCLSPPGGAGLMRAVCAASVEGALPAVVSHDPTLRTAPVDAPTDYVRADSRFSNNGKDQEQGWPMSVAARRIPLSAPWIDERDEELVLEVLRSGQLSLGPAGPRFEGLLAEAVGAPHCAAVSSGTAGLHLCMRLAGVGPGDEVITSPYSFVASANCAIYEGATPVFADVDARHVQPRPRGGRGGGDVAHEGGRRGRHLRLSRASSTSSARSATGTASTSSRTRARRSGRCTRAARSARTATRRRGRSTRTSRSRRARVAR